MYQRTCGLARSHVCFNVLFMASSLIYLFLDCLFLSIGVIVIPQVVFVGLKPHKAGIWHSDTRRLALTWRPAANHIGNPISRGGPVVRSADDCDHLREENAGLRAQINSLISGNPEIKSQVSQLLEEHAALARLAQAAGEYIPSFIEDDLTVDLETEANASDAAFLDQDVLFEIEGDETLVFKFQNASVVSNNLVSSSMASSSDKWSYGSAATTTGSGMLVPASPVASKNKSAKELAIGVCNEAVDNHVPSDIVKGKEDWLYITVPSKLVAGGKAMLYFNKEQSQVLQHQQSVELYTKFNNWELDMGTSDRIDMQPLGSLGPGTNFYKAELTIPTDAYEMNFIFSNKDGLYDNNESQNYSLPIDGEMTQKKWIDTAPERAEAEFLKRKEQERIAAEKAEKEREVAALEQDAQKAQDMVTSIKTEYDTLTQNASTSFRSDSGEQVIVSEQKTTRGAEHVKILYNKSATCLAEVDTKLNPIMLRVGHNGWQNPVDLQLKAVKAKQSKQADSETGEWWEASIKVPLDALALNMVFFSGDIFDNNNQNDYSIFVDRGKDVAEWADSILQPLRKKVTDARRQKEKEDKELQEKKMIERQAIRVC